MPVVRGANQNSVNILTVEDISEVFVCRTSFVSSTRGLHSVILFHLPAGIIDSVGVHVAYSEDVGLVKTQNFPHIAESHTSYADTADSDAIAWCAGCEYAGGNYLRPHRGCPNGGDR